MAASKVLHYLPPLENLVLLETSLERFHERVQSTARGLSLPWQMAEAGLGLAVVIPGKLPGGRLVLRGQEGVGKEWMYWRLPPGLRHPRYSLSLALRMTTSQFGINCGTWGSTTRGSGRFHFAGGRHRVILRDYYWLCAKEFLRSYGMPGTELQARQVPTYPLYYCSSPG